MGFLVLIPLGLGVTMRAVHGAPMKSGHLATMIDFEARPPIWV